MPSLGDTRFLVLDVETTGLNPQEDRIVQIALVSVHCGRVAQLGAMLVNPERPIPPRASAIHHITNRQVEQAPTWAAVWPNVERLLLEVDVIVAHNAVFDRSFLPSVNKPWLCTKRLAQRLWPSAPNFKNQTLRYWLDLALDATAHDAAGDALVTAHVLMREIEAYQAKGSEDNPAALIQWTDSPVRIEIMPFGKHFGERLADIPVSYIRWALANVTDLDPDLRWSLESVLQQAASA